MLENNMLLIFIGNILAVLNAWTFFVCFFSIKMINFKRKIFNITFANAKRKSLMFLFVEFISNENSLPSRFFFVLYLLSYVKNSGLEYGTSFFPDNDEFSLSRNDVLSFNDECFSVSVSIEYKIWVSISFRSLSQTEKKIVKSIQINKPSAIIPAADKHTASVCYFQNHYLFV